MRLRLHGTRAPKVVTIASIGDYTEAELFAACRVACALRSVLYLCAPYRP